MNLLYVDGLLAGSLTGGWITNTDIENTSEENITISSARNEAEQVNPHGSGCKTLNVPLLVSSSSLFSLLTVLSNKAGTETLHTTESRTGRGSLKYKLYTCVRLASS